MKNIIAAIILILAMLLSLSSCLTAINVAGQDGTDEQTNAETADTFISENTVEETETENTPDEPADTETDFESVIYNPYSIETKDVSQYENGVIPEYPSEELISRITDDFFGDKLDENHYLVYYYGNYDGAVPVKFEHGLYLCAYQESYVAGYRFSDAYCNDYIRVWKDGKFYNLNEAYESGLLTEDQIANIAWLCYTGNYIHIRERGF